MTERQSRIVEAELRWILAVFVLDIITSAKSISYPCLGEAIREHDRALNARWNAYQCASTCDSTAEAA